MKEPLCGQWHDQAHIDHRASPASWHYQRHCTRRPFPLTGLPALV